MYLTKAYGTVSDRSPLATMWIKRRDPGPTDVRIEILYCGVCHTDLHHVRNDWKGTVYPCIPGHEIVGRVRETGAQVRRFREGDVAAVGCLVDSCRSCGNCLNGQQQFCDRGAIFTYNSRNEHTGGVTYGGYSASIVVNEAFVLRLPNGLCPAASAPLLCAGITTYSPLRHWTVTKGQKVGVVGLGGLGHMAVKFAAAFGAPVVFKDRRTRKTMRCD